MKREKCEPPALATAMLGLFVDPQRSEAMAGDLIEEFGIGERSKLWYWRQVMRSVIYAGSKSVAQTIGPLMAGMTLVAAVCAIIIVAVRVWLPKLMATRAQPVEFAFTFAALVFMLAGTMAGGYVTARLGRQAEKRSSLLLGVVVLLTGFLWLVIGAPAWFVGLVFLLSIPSAWVGGYLRAQQKVRA